jgi:hypothetical protein
MNRAEVGKGDVAKDSPAARAVDAGGLFETGVERREPGQEQHGVGADHGEDEGDAERESAVDS